jgi:hypothetical protein
MAHGHHHTNTPPAPRTNPSPLDPEHDIDARSATTWVVGGTSCCSCPSGIMVPIFMRVQDAERADEGRQGPEHRTRTSPSRPRSSSWTANPTKKNLRPSSTRCASEVARASYREAPVPRSPAATAALWCPGTMPTPRRASRSQGTAASQDRQHRHVRRPEPDVHRRTRLPVPLKQLFPGKQPVVLLLGYYSCPAMCGQVLEATFRALSDVDLQPGTDYRILNVSIDPRETVETAKARKDVFLPRSHKTGGDEAWRVLIGDEASIKKLTASGRLQLLLVGTDQAVRAPAVADLPHARRQGQPHHRQHRVRARGPAAGPRRGQRRQARHLLGSGQAQLPDLRSPHQLLFPRSDDRHAHRRCRHRRRARPDDLDHAAPGTRGTNRRRRA